MYITKISLTNVRSLKSICWEIDRDHCPGWHVIIGDNGSGKSTFLKAISLVLIFKQFDALRQNSDEWLNRGADSGYISIQLLWNPDNDHFTGQGKTYKRQLLSARVDLVRLQNKVSLRKGRSKEDPSRYIWGESVKGWFSAAYGPFRRFSGGDKDYQKLFYTHPRLAAHLSIFGEDVALGESIEWLKELQFKKLESQSERSLIDTITLFVNNSDLLPHGAKINKITSEGVEFIDGNDCPLLVEELSDGYRSILSMTFELIRQLVQVYGIDQVFGGQDTPHIIAPGVVLIDEIDVHLHPTWQKQIGIWFCKYFPNIQFIVSTHSPIICQAATKGTVYRLPKPGSDDSGHMITGQALNRLLYGNVLDAYGTEVFGENVTRSEISRQKQERLAQLNQKVRYEELTEEERQEHQKLQAMMPSNPDVIFGPVER
ncbi:AAA family ATPase [Halomicronema sp. CCY15110]|uniref:AAA family ATPase n=1 Tax=Halomicronema sp. CCY15110 TaxID=2767773 RepID=UPI00194F0666|nr:AAA family ATPase [Halomicronema sp. CCY15110]